MSHHAGDDLPDTDEPAVTEAARKIAAGQPVDWPTMESSVSDEQLREVLERLQDVEGIASFHRGWRRDSPQPATPQPLEWGSLKIVEEIGRGSFGRVYRAWDAGLERHVALKILDPGLTTDSPYGRAVIDEGRHLAKVHHRNIVSIHRAERVDGRLGLEMELVTGRTLADIVGTEGPFAADEAALICRDVSRALAAVHKAGLVHRDVKAQNVIRETGGRVVLMDFGAGRPSESVTVSDIAGTPLYLAPEVLAGAPPTPQSDLYSLGVLLYYLVTGSFPVGADTIDELRAAHRSGVSSRLRDARPDLPGGFIDVVERALASDPSKRIDSAGVFEAELSRVLGHVDLADARVPTGKLLPVSAALAIAWALGLTAWTLWPRSVATPQANNGAAAAVQSIAVLPFVSRSTGADDEYIADGMTDELIAALGKVRGLRVAARTSAFWFKSRPGAARDVARQLGVGTLLEGTVRRNGQHIRVTASLIGATDGLQRWSETYDSGVGGVFAVQDEITRAVIAQLSIQLGDAELRASQAGRTRDPEAHDLYLRGLAAANQLDEPGLRRALDLYQRAVSRDPTFARAYAGIAMVHSYLADAYEPASQAYPAAKRAALAAIAQDELVAEAHAVLGYAGFAVDWNRVAAERSYRRALAIDPNSVTAHMFFGTHLCGFGEFDEGWAHLTRGSQLDPLSPVAAWMAEFCAFMNQRHQDVIEAHNRTEAIAPGFFYFDALVADAYRALGDFPAALREYKAVEPALNGVPHYGLALLYVQMNRTREALEIVRRIDQAAVVQYIPLVQRAIAHGAVGDMDKGVALLQQAFDSRELVLAAFRQKLRHSALLKDPRALRILNQAEAIWHQDR